MHIVCPDKSYNSDSDKIPDWIIQEDEDREAKK